MISRRDFIQKSSLAGIVFELQEIPQWLVAENEGIFSYQSSFLKMTLMRNRPEFVFFSIDSLGGAQFQTNPLLGVQKENDAGYLSSVGRDGISYFTEKSGKQKHAWRIQCHTRKMTISKEWSLGQGDIVPLDITFSQVTNH